MTVSRLQPDIVERLTARAKVAREENTGTGLGDALHFEEAAAEIERLRAAPVPQRDAEPVAWQFQRADGAWVSCTKPCAHDLKIAPEKFRPLYAAPSRLDAGSVEAAKYICRLFLCAQGDVCDQTGCKPGTKAYEHLNAILDMSSPSALPAGEAVADQIIGQIEERFPNWRSSWHGWMIGPKR